MKRGTRSRKRLQRCDRCNVGTFLGTYARSQTQPDGVRRKRSRCFSQEKWSDRARRNQTQKSGENSHAALTAYSFLDEEILALQEAGTEVFVISTDDQRDRVFRGVQIRGLPDGTLWRERMENQFSYVHMLYSKVVLLILHMLDDLRAHDDVELSSGNPPVLDIVTFEGSTWIGIRGTPRAEPPVRAVC